MVMYPLARPSEPSGIASIASTRVADEIMAAPSPWMKRKRMSCVALEASPQSRELAVILAISWAVIAYQLAGISLSVVFGRLGDIHGRHVIYGPGDGEDVRVQGAGERGK